jgi:hypothetical protein
MPPSLALESRLGCEKFRERVIPGQISSAQRESDMHRDNQRLFGAMEQEHSGPSLLLRAELSAVRPLNVE